MPSPRTTTAASFTAGWRSSADSTSAVSTRKPRTFTCVSTRPRNSSVPSASQRAKSPVRYSRAPGSPNGSGTKRSAVSSGRFQYPRPRPSPAAYSSPGVPTGTAFSARSRMCTRVFAMGRPMGTLRASLASSLMRWQAVKVVFSVGP